MQKGLINRWPVIGCLRSRIVQASLLLALVAAVAVSVGWSDKDHGRVKLGGTWVGQYGDIAWTGTYAPGPSGQQAAVTLQWITMSAEFEALIASLGADDGSIASGSLRMISRDTAKGTLIWYFYAAGTPSTTEPVAGKVTAIAVMANEWYFTSPTTAVGKHQLKIYGAKGSMVPDEANIKMVMDFDGVQHVKVN